MSEWEAFQAVNFDWTMHLKSVWKDTDYDVSSLHEDLRNEIIRKFMQLVEDKTGETPLGEVITGIAGSGKTHLLGTIRRSVFQQKQWFIFIDMTDVHDFYQTVLQGYIDSLQAKYLGEKLQYQELLERLIAKAGCRQLFLQNLAVSSEKYLIEDCKALIEALRKNYRMEMQKYQDVLRALMMFHSNISSISDLGYGYLLGMDLDAQDKKKFGFFQPPGTHAQRIQALSWIMSIVGASVLALDQLDAIVMQKHLASGEETPDRLTEENKTALAIIEGIGGGLSSLREFAQRTLILVSCLETTWIILSKKAISSHVHRYHEPLYLKSISKNEIAQEIVRKRLSDAYQKKNFHPPYPTWPFRPEAFDSVIGLSPREILRHCDNIRRRFQQSGKITEVFSIIDNHLPPPPPPPPPNWEKLDQQFNTLKSEADLSRLLDENQEDDGLGALLPTLCRCLLRETAIPGVIDAIVDQDFLFNKSYPPLHVRIRLVYHNQNDREEHYCLRALLRNNPVAMQNRLKAAMTASGIDRRLPFRRLALVRSSNFPPGVKTKQLVEDFLSAGGMLINPQEEDIRTAYALQKIEAMGNPDWEEWLSYHKPAANLAMMKDACTWLKERIPASFSPQVEIAKPEIVVSEIKPQTTIISPIPEKPIRKDIYFGKKIIGERLGDSLTIPAAVLTRHTVILAGSGSGKTVLVRRMVEEAALLGIPAIVIDAANDLALLGEPWPQLPAGWNPEDNAKAQEYFQKTECILWTPGLAKGNPLCLDPLPDFSAVKNDEDELNRAIAMVRGAFREIIAPGESASAHKKIGAFSAMLYYYARMNGTGLMDLIELLSDLPAEAGGGITGAPKMAAEMADQLRAAMAMNPLLKSDAPTLDPAMLLGKTQASRKTRISVINFTGLPTQDSREQFVNQLAMILFTWIKKYPAPVGTPLQGLLILDEAKDYVPSGKSSACKESLKQLAAQARKYGMGLIFATQTPKSIDHNIIANCTTHFYGHASSPAAIETVQEQIKLRGGSGHDIPTLGKGRFYVYSETINGEKAASPIKFAAPWCLSYHPESPLKETEIGIRAEKCRNEFKG